MTPSRLLVALAVLLASAALLLWFGQRSLLYFPTTYPLDAARGRAAAAGPAPILLAAGR